MKKLLSLCTFIFLIVVLTLTGCSVSTLELSSPYIIEKMKAGDETLTYYSVLELDADNSLKEVWLVVSGLDESSADVGIYFANSETGFTKSYGSKTTITADFLKKSKYVVKIPVDSNCNSRDYLQLTVQNTMKIYEIFVVDEKDKQVEVTLVKAGKRTSEESLTDTDLNAMSKDELVTSREKNTALCLVNEQDKFNLKKLNSSYNKALEKVENSSSSSSDSSSSSSSSSSSGVDLPTIPASSGSEN